MRCHPSLSPSYCIPKTCTRVSVTPAGNGRGRSRRRKRRRRKAQPVSPCRCPQAVPAAAAAPIPQPLLPPGVEFVPGTFRPGFPPNLSWPHHFGRQTLGDLSRSLQTHSLGAGERTRSTTRAHGASWPGTRGDIFPKGRHHRQPCHRDSRDHPSTQPGQASRSHVLSVPPGDTARHAGAPSIPLQAWHRHQDAHSTARKITIYYHLKYVHSLEPDSQLFPRAQGFGPISTFSSRKTGKIQQRNHTGTPYLPSTPQHRRVSSGEGFQQMAPHGDKG